VDEQEDCHPEGQPKTRFHGAPPSFLIFCFGAGAHHADDHEYEGGYQEGDSYGVFNQVVDGRGFA
jgi:hypothetical protein